MPTYSWLDHTEFLAINRTEMDEFKKKINALDKEAQGMSKLARSIWEGEKNSLKSKINDFEHEYFRLIGRKNKDNDPDFKADASYERARRRLRRDLAVIRQSYFRAQALLERRDREGRKKEEEEAKKNAPPLGRSAGISL